MSGRSQEVLSSHNRIKLLIHHANSSQDAPPSASSFRKEYAKQLQFLFGNNRYWLHIGIWSLLFIIAILDLKWLFITDVVFDIRYNHKSILNVDNHSIFFFIFLLVNVILVYTYLLVISPYAKYKLKRRYIYYYILIAMLLFYAVLFIMIFMVTQEPDNTKMPARMINAVILSSMLAAYFLSVFYFLDIYDKMRPLKQYESLLSETVEAESNLLASQINPHFLFNTLNNIYGLSLTDIDKAKQSIVKLEDLITYMHHDNEYPWIWLQDEINFLNSYIQLEQLRNQARTIRVLFTVDGVVEGFKIAPLILINFVENAFKHSIAIGERTSTINININIKDDRVHCYIFNTKQTVKHNDLNHKYSGIGIQNVLRRLALIYNNNFTLKVVNSKKVYEVKLTLKNYNG